MSQSCCGAGNIMLLACSGGSNVGQLANQAAIELTQEGLGRIFCLAGIGAHLDGFVQSAKDNDNVIVIDGCEVECSKAIMDHMKIPIKKHLVITRELGIEKNKNFNLDRETIERVKKTVKL